MRVWVSCVILTILLLSIPGWTKFGNDVNFDWVSKNWGLTRVRARDAWNLVSTNKRVVVAEVDTGIDTENSWLYPVVSKFGFNFVENNKNMFDDHGHGTHVAGIIATTANNHVLILPVRYYSERQSGEENLRKSIKALYFSVDHGAKIINYSGGGPNYSAEEFKALKYAERSGVLVVAAAGNEKENLDSKYNSFYPASYGLKNIITVAATNYNEDLIRMSNYGKKVDVAAPGEVILSTVPGDKFVYMSGTSQATAFVSGIAALILAVHPKLKPKQVKEIIMKSVDKYPNLSNKCRSGGRVNEYAALELAKSFTSNEH